MTTKAVERQKLKACPSSTTPKEVTQGKPHPMRAERAGSDIIKSPEVKAPDVGQL